jgi:5,10-methenyltetrahydromethanopterin hydrogenase
MEIMIKRKEVNSIIMIKKDKENSAIKDNQEEDLEMIMMIMKIEGKENMEIILKTDLILVLLKKEDLKQNIFKKIIENKDDKYMSFFIDLIINIYLINETKKQEKII